MRVVIDTGVFSASLSRRRRQRFEPQIALMAGNQLFLAAVTVSELRYGALVAGWGDARRQRLEESIHAATVVPVSDKLLTVAAELRLACRLAGRLDHLALQANSIEAFDEIRKRLLDRDATDGFVTDFGHILSLFFRDSDGQECEVCVPNPDAVPGVHNPPGTPAGRYHPEGTPPPARHDDNLHLRQGGTTSCRSEDRGAGGTA